MAKETLLNSKDDLDWLFDVHLKELKAFRAGTKSAIIVGNEDYPDSICLYASTDPDVDDPYLEFVSPSEDDESNRDDEDE